MKLKRLREDFVVRELSDFPLGDGPFATYRLDKSGLGTPEAITEILKVWNLSRRAVGYGGLKDRHANTSQIITLHRGPTRNIEQRGFTLTYLGQARRAFEAKDISANQFDVTLRDLTQEQLEQLQSLLPAIAAGVPNYFDDQRFGSLGESGQFVAQPWCLGDYERALWLAIAEVNSHDRPREKEQKQMLREHWGDWVKCKALLDRSHRRSIVTYLVDHPADFKRALALLRSDLRSIYMAAFQSHLWNEIVSRWLQQHLPGDQWYTRRGAAGELTFWSSPTPEVLQQVSDLQIPLPSARCHEWPEGIEELLNEVLSAWSMDRHQVRVKYPRDTFFSKGMRAVLLKPRNFKSRSELDELNSSRHKLILTFELPRGAYATMIVRSLM